VSGITGIGLSLQSCLIKWRLGGPSAAGYQWPPFPNDILAEIQIQ